MTPADDPPGHVQAAAPKPPHHASLDPAPDTYPRAPPTMHPHKGSMTALTVGALGIVYGDIGTSPLYALNQIFLGRADLPLTPANVLGGISLVI